MTSICPAELRRMADLQSAYLRQAAAELERHTCQPPGRRPLSDQELLHLIAEYPSNRLLLARAVERAHGIQTPIDPI